MNELYRPPFAHMTAEEFLAWEGDGSGRKFHLIDGEVRPMSPASWVHSFVQSNLSRLIGNAAEQIDPALGVATEGAIVPALTALENVRVPDIVVVRAIALRGEVALPHPILIVEILSPGNAATTRDNVRAYATLPSVREMAVVHTTRAEVEVHIRDAAGHWPANPTSVKPPGTLRLPSVGLDCTLDAVYRNTWLAEPSPSSSR